MAVDGFGLGSVALGLALGRQRRPDSPLDAELPAGGHVLLPAEEDGAVVALGGRFDRARPGGGEVGAAGAEVQAPVPEGDAAVVTYEDGHLVAPHLPVAAPDFEDVRVVHVDGQLYDRVLGPLGEVGDGDLLVEHLGDDPLAADAQRSARQPHGRRVALAVLLAAAGKIGVGHLDGAAVVARAAGAEQHGPGAVHLESQARHDPRIAGIESEPARIRPDIAERVREQIQVFVLEHLDAAQVCRPDDPRLLRRELVRRRTADQGWQ